MSVIKKILWLVVFFGCWLRVDAQSSVLHSGDWYKVAVEKNGVYRISFDMLKKMGIDPGKIIPKNVKIFGLEGGMLPQSNAISRHRDLEECAIAVIGEDDGKFDKGDYILFFAEGPDNYEYDISRGIFFYENNLFTDRNYYFLTIGQDAGKRIGTSENIPGDYPIINSFNAFAYYEKESYNIERSGREWYGEKFGIETTYTLTYNIPGITAGSEMKIVSDVMGQSYTDATFKLFFNNVPVAEQKIQPIPNGRYSVKGLHNRDTITVSVNDLQAPARTSQEVRYEFVKGTGYSQGYLDFILLNFDRDLALYDNQTFFLSASSLNNSVSTFVVSQVKVDAMIWDITDPYNISAQQFEVTESGARFSTSTSVLKKWMVFDKSVPEPAFAGRVENQDLSGMSTPDLLIITHPDFKAQAERLAAHRASYSNWTVQVVTTQQIYNQFSGGRQDVTALRDFAKLLRDKDPSAFKAILLFGKGSYDYKDRLPNNTNFVPTYESRNSLHPLQTYSSDDYFTFLEDSEGDWQESPAQQHTLDVGVGRLPVKSTEEAENVVNKIIQYETDQTAFGSWRKKVVFVADDGNSEDGFTSLHQYQADQLATFIEEDVADVDARRLFMGSYKKKVQPNSETVPDMTDDIKRAFDLGALIINFTGHGSEFVWTDERVLTEKTIAELKNERYPFLVTATCEFGRQDDPLQISSAERSVIQKTGGTIGLVTTARPVNATTNFSLNEAFYEALFQRNGNTYNTIGEVFRNTKNNSTSGVSNRNFSLIGDPSMLLALPAYTAEIASVKTANGSDTLKALSTVTVTGQIVDPTGGKATSFNGVLEATLYDRKKDIVTIGKNNPPFEYQQWDNAVFRGKATVIDGEFTFSFVMTSNISEEVAGGKFSLYAYDPDSGLDAKGVHTDFRIGEIEADVPSDVTPPTIRLFIGDTTFVNGGIATPDTYLIAKLEDESGINISGYGGESSIEAQLDDDTTTYVLNDYYIGDIDTYKSGTIRFPILGLTPGPHTLTVRARDVHNNQSVASISFIVTNGEGLVIEEFGNFPNPFSDNTTFFFTHSHSGDDLKAQLFIFNHAGQLIRSAEISVPKSEYHVNLLELNTWEDSGKKLPPGLYLARVIVRSMTDGSKNEKVTKLIVLN